MQIFRLKNWIDAVDLKLQLSFFFSLRAFKNVKETMTDKQVVEKTTMESIVWTDTICGYNFIVYDDLNNKKFDFGEAKNEKF